MILQLYSQTRITFFLIYDSVLETSRGLDSLFHKHFSLQWVKETFFGTYPHYFFVYMYILQPYVRSFLTVEIFDTPPLFEIYLAFNTCRIKQRNIFKLKWLLMKRRIFLLSFYTVTFASYEL